MSIARIAAGRTVPKLLAAALLALALQACGPEGTEGTEESLEAFSEAAAARAEAAAGPGGAADAEAQAGEDGPVEQAVLAPPCVYFQSRGRIADGPYAYIRNACASPYLVRVDFSYCPDSACRWIYPGQTQYHRPVSGGICLGTSVARSIQRC